MHQPGGLSLLTQADSYLWALATTQDNLEGRTPPGPDQIIAAIPVPTGRSDTTVTYLYGSEGTGTLGMVRLADQYAAHFQNQPAVQTYVTGFVPAQIAQGDYLNARLGLFELASLVLILLVVALAFRSLLAPLVVVGIAAIGYLVYLPVLTLVAAAAGFEVPGQLEPVLLALLLGVVTDYCVLFFHTFRDELDTGRDNMSAARSAIRRNASIIAVAGLTVAGGTIALLAAPFGIFRALGPALALTVLIGLVLCLTLTPAVMTILGWRLFTVVPVRGSRRATTPDAEHSLPAELERRESRLVNRLTKRGPALVATALVVVVLGLATVPLTQARFDLSFAAGLPDEDSVAEGAQLLQEVGLRGICGPTEVLLEQAGITDKRVDLIRMEQALTTQPGVARVLGPDDSPFTEPRGVVLSETGDAARFVVIFDSDPLAARAIDDLHTLQGNVEAIVARSGLAGAEVTITGQTIIAAEVAQLTRDEPGGGLGHRLGGGVDHPRAVPAGVGRAGRLAGLQCSQRGGRVGPDHPPVPRHPGRTRVDLLRPLRRRRPVDRAGIGLQRLRGRPHLAGGQASAAGRGAVHRRAPVIAGHHHRRVDPGRDVRPGGHHSAVDIPANRLRHDRRTPAGHPRHPAHPDPGRADAARTVRGLARQAHPHPDPGGTRRSSGAGGSPVSDSSTPRSGRRGWRTALEALLVTAGLVLLLWGADALSRVGAETLLERNIQDVTGVVERPEVEIDGVFFLPQVLRGAYQEVQVSVVGIRSGPLQVERVESRMHDVRVPFKDVVLRDIRRVGIGRSIDQINLRFQDLNSYFEATGREVRLARTDDGQVQMRGFFSVLGQTVQATAEVDLTVDGSQLRVTPRRIDTAGAPLSPARRLFLEQRLTFTVPLGTLPFGRELTGLVIVENGLRLTAEGKPSSCVREVAQARCN